MEALDQFKLVIIGPEAAGKTCLVRRFIHQSFSKSYEPNAIDDFRKQEVVDGSPILFNITDTGGDSALDDIRAEACQEADVIIIAFSLGAKELFQRVRTYREDAQMSCNKLDVGFLLVGCQNDAPRDVPQRDVQAVVDEWGRTSTSQVKYVECSAKTGVGVDEAFHEAARLARVLHHGETDNEAQSSLGNSFGMLGASHSIAPSTSLLSALPGKTLRQKLTGTEATGCSPGSNQGLLPLIQLSHRQSSMGISQGSGETDKTAQALSPPPDAETSQQGAPSKEAPLAKGNQLRTPRTSPPSLSLLGPTVKPSRSRQRTSPPPLLSCELTEFLSMSPEKTMALGSSLTMDGPGADEMTSSLLQPLLDPSHSKRGELHLSSSRTVPQASFKQGPILCQTDSAKDDCLSVVTHSKLLSQHALKAVIRDDTPVADVSPADSPHSPSAGSVRTRARTTSSRCSCCRCCCRCCPKRCVVL